MELSTHIAKHLRALYFGGNWTCVNFKEELAGITWEQATTKIHDFNTIAVLVFHTSYYFDAALAVLKGEAFHAKDEYSFLLPPINAQEDWEQLVATTWERVEELALLIEKFPEEKLWDTFVHEKYGNYYRNFNGIIEHSHYHLGQIVLIKKLLLQTKS
ncbi:MAG: DinB family protein [Bacteroidia bacterium]